MSAVSLLDSAPTIEPSPETFERIKNLMSYRGAPRTECDDVTWDLLQAAVKFLVPHISPDPYDQLPIHIAGALRGLKDSRPVEQLLLDLIRATDNDMVWDVWCVELRDGAPVADFSALLHLADSYRWPPMKDPTPDVSTPTDYFYWIENGELHGMAPKSSGAPPVPTPIQRSRFTPTVPPLAAPRPKYIVKGLLFEKTLGMLFGKWGTGKSTVAIELAADIALGTPWHGRKVRQGKIVYIACESSHGLRARLDALLRARGLTINALGENFLEIANRPHLLKPEEVKELIAELKPHSPISLIVIDTYARATAGSEENAAKDASIAIHNCQEIQEATGACVLLVHHTGKDESRGARGSSALPAGVDTEITLERPDDHKNFRVARVGKQRDARDYHDLFNFELKTVELGVDEDGDPVTSTVVREVEPKAESKLKVIELPKSPVRRAIRGVLGGAMRPMSFEELIATTKTKLAPPEPGEKDRRRDRIKQAFERMLADNELHMDANRMVTPMDPANPFRPVPDRNGDLTGGAS